MKATKLRSALLLGGVLALAITGCSSTSADTGADTGSGAKPIVNVSIGSTAGMAAEFFNFGVKQGYFKDEGINLKVEVQQSGGATLPAVVGGHLDFGSSNMVSVIQARSQGLPLVAVAGGTGSTADPLKDFSAIMVSPDSKIKTVADLKGKTVAVNALGTISELSLDIAFQDAGIDPKSVKFLELGFPDMTAALKSGQIDAATVMEPYLSRAVKAGDKVLTSSYYRPNLAIGSVLTSSTYADKNPKTVEALQRAVATTTDKINGDASAFRKFLIADGAIPTDISDEMIIPVFFAAVDKPSITELANAMVKLGWIPKSPDIDATIWKKP